MFWKKKNNKPDHQNATDPKDSIGAMISEATRQGWLQDSDLGFIPELVSIYKNAADHFTNIIDKSEPKMRETLMYHTCRYLFAKGVEGVILWGISPHGKVSVYFHSKHLVESVETEVPKHLHAIVINSMPIGESLFRAHQYFIIQSQKKGHYIDLQNEMCETVQWIPRLGISYALYNKFHELR